MQPILTICCDGKLGGEVAAFLEDRGYRVREAGSAEAALAFHRQEHGLSEIVIQHVHAEPAELTTTHASARVARPVEPSR